MLGWFLASAKLLHEMDNSISDMFSTSDIFETSNITINNNYEQLRIIFEEVLLTVSFVDVEENVFKDEIPKLKQACNDIVEQISEHLKNIQSNAQLLDEIKKLIQRYINLLHFVLSAVKYVSNKIPFVQIQSLPLAVCEILLQVFKHCRESDTFYGNYFASVSYLLTDLFKKANEIQSSFLYLLNNNIIFDLSAEEEIVFLVQVAEILAAIGKIVSGLDIKTAAELWKVYLMLLQKYNEYIKNRVDIETPIKYFCTEIMNSLDSTESMNDIKHIEKTLKIISFNLKIVIKLCSLFECTGEATRKLFDLLIKLNKYSVPLLRIQKKAQKYIDIMQSYVAVAAEPLLNHLISNRCFVQSYFQNITNQFKDDDNRLPSLLLTVSILKIILNGDSDVRKPWISDDFEFNIIFTIFSSLEHCHVEFSLDYPIQIQDSSGSSRTTSLYEYLFVHLVSVILTFNPKQIKSIQNLLFKSVMQPRLWKSLIAADVWIVLGRYGSSEFCFESLKFLINIYTKVQGGNRIEIMYLENLIRRNYKILSSKHETEIIGMYPYNNFIKLWTVIEMKNEPMLRTKLPSHFDEASKMIEIFIANKSTSTFNCMCDMLDFLSTNEFEELGETDITNLIIKITALWNLNVDTELEPLWMVRFINCRAKITSCLIKYFGNPELLNVLQSMKNTNQENSQKAHISILKSLSNKKIPFSTEQKLIFNLISKLFNNLLKTDNVIIKQEALESFTYFANHTHHEEIVGNIVEDDRQLQQELTNYLQKNIPESNQSRVDYFKKQNKIIWKHECSKNFKGFETQQKREKNNSDMYFREIMQNMEHNCNNLVELCKNETIPENFLIELNTIVSKLQTFLNK